MCISHPERQYLIPTGRPSQAGTPAVFLRGHFLAWLEWIVWYVIGSLNHTLLLITILPLLWGGSLGLRYFYVGFHEGIALAGGTGWGTSGRKENPYLKHTLLLVGMKSGYKGFKVIILSPSGWKFPVKDGTLIGSIGLCCCQVNNGSS